MIVRILVVLLALAVGGLLWFRGDAHSAAARADRAEQSAAAAEGEVRDLRRQIDAERAHAAQMAETARQFEQEKIDAQSRADRVVADLRAGNLELHARWQARIATDQLSAAVAAGSGIDGGTDDRAESAGRAIGAAAQCDAQVRGLQAVIRADRGIP